MSRNREEYFRKLGLNMKCLSYSFSAVEDPELAGVREEKSRKREINYLKSIYLSLVICQAINLKTTSCLTIPT